MSETIFYFQGWRVPYVADRPTEWQDSAEPVLLQVTAPRDGAFTFTVNNMPFPASREGGYEFDFGGAEWRLDGELITEDYLERTFDEIGVSGGTTAWHMWSFGQVMLFLRPWVNDPYIVGDPPAMDNRFNVLSGGTWEDPDALLWKYQGSQLKINKDNSVSTFWIGGSAPGAGDPDALVGDVAYANPVQAWDVAFASGITDPLFTWPGENTHPLYTPSDPIRYDSLSSLILISEDLNAGVTLDGDSVAIEGGDEFDLFISTTGNDSFDGGPGSGAVVYIGNAADYIVTTDEDTGITTVTDTRTDPAAVTNGTDTLERIERLIFADEIVVLDEGAGDGDGPGPGPIIDPDPEPDPDPDPEPDPDPDPDDDDDPEPDPDDGPETFALQVGVGTAVGTPLAGATVTLSPPGGGAALAEATTGSNGVVTFDLPAGTEGRLEASLPHDGTPAVGTADALEILRIAVGLDASWGPANPAHFIAADVNRDGTVTTADALEVLRHAVGLDSDYAPEWVFLDVWSDPSHITPDAVAYDTGVDLAALSADGEAGLAGILLGSLTEFA